MKRFMATLLAMLLAAVLICLLSIETLSIGERGERVFDMQVLLTDLGYNSDYPGRGLDSFWDPERSKFTEAEQQSLREFQAEWDLPQTGRYGPLTRRTLERVHASRFDAQTDVFHRNCVWNLDEEKNQLEFRCVIKQEPSFGGFDSLTTCYYCEDADGNRIGPEQGLYFSQTTEEFVGNDTCTTDWLVFEDGARIDKVFVAVKALDSTEGDSIVVPDDQLHFVEYRIR